MQECSWLSHYLLPGKRLLASIVIGILLASCGGDDKEIINVQSENPGDSEGDAGDSGDNTDDSGDGADDPNDTGPEAKGFSFSTSSYTGLAKISYATPLVFREDAKVLLGLHNKLLDRKECNSGNVSITPDTESIVVVTTDCVLDLSNLDIDELGNTGTITLNSQYTADNFSDERVDGLGAFSFDLDFSSFSLTTDISNEAQSKRVVDGKLSYFANIASSRTSLGQSTKSLNVVNTEEGDSDSFNLNFTNSGSLKTTNKADSSVEIVDEFLAEIFFSDSSDDKFLFNINTDLNLQILEGEAYPSSGKQTVTDSEGNVVTIEPVDANEVTVSLDLEDDGTIEESQRLMWSEFAPEE